MGALSFDVKSTRKPDVVTGTSFFRPVIVSSELIKKPKKKVVKKKVKKRKIVKRKKKRVRKPKKRTRKKKTKKRRK